MFVNLSAYRSRSPGRRLPRGLPFRSWDGPQPLPCRKVLLVEHRDEVFARLAWDLADAGLQVRRVTCAAEASRECARFKPDVLAANVDLPDGSGWLLTAKLRLMSATPPIWLYVPWPSPDDAAMAKFVGADDLIVYCGDLFRLSDEIVSRVSVFAGDVRCGVRCPGLAQPCFHFQEPA